MKLYQQFVLFTLALTLVLGLTLYVVQGQEEATDFEKKLVRQSVIDCLKNGENWRACRDCCRGFLFEVYPDDTPGICLCKPKIIPAMIKYACETINPVIRDANKDCQYHGHSKCDIMDTTYKNLENDIYGKCAISRAILSEMERFSEYYGKEKKDIMRAISDKMAGQCQSLDHSDMALNNLITKWIREVNESIREERIKKYGNYDRRFYDALDAVFWTHTRSSDDTYDESECNECCSRFSQKENNLILKGYRANSAQCRCYLTDESLTIQDVGKGKRKRRREREQTSPSQSVKM